MTKYFVTMAYMQGKVIQNTGLAHAWYDNEGTEHGRTKNGAFYDFEQTT